MKRKRMSRPPVQHEIKITRQGTEYVGHYQVSDGMIEVSYKDAYKRTHASSMGDEGNIGLARLILGELVNENPS